MDSSEMLIFINRIFLMILLILGGSTMYFFFLGGVGNQKCKYLAAAFALFAFITAAVYYYVKTCIAYVAGDCSKIGTLLFLNIIKEKPYFIILFTLMAAVWYRMMKIFVFLSGRESTKEDKIVMLISPVLIVLITLLLGELCPVFTIFA